MTDIPEHMLKVRVEVARRFLKGSGIEIGALHNPIPVPPDVHIKYVDRLSLDDLRSHYPELHGCRIIEPDIVDDGEVLSSVENGTLDFIVANHMIEHCENPIGAIRNHLLKIRPGGTLYYAAPEKNQSFDAGREVTPFQHLVDDDRYGPDRSRAQHFMEWVRRVNRVTDPEEAAEEAAGLMRRNYSIHFHVWDESAFKSFILETRRYLNKLFDICYLTRNDTEMIAVLRKRRRRAWHVWNRRTH